MSVPKPESNTNRKKIDNNISNNGSFASKSAMKLLSGAYEGGRYESEREKKTKVIDKLFKYGDA